MSQEIIQGYRLSPQQRRLWLLRLFDRAAVCAVRLGGELEVEALRQAIRQVVSQQEILRTSFKLLPGMTIPVQVISDDTDFAFTSLDLTQLNAAVESILTESHVRRRLEKVLNSGYDERHLYILADYTAMPESVSLALITPGIVPREALSLPDGLTMLWLLMFTRQVLVAARDGWTSYARPL